VPLKLRANRRVPYVAGRCHQFNPRLWETSNNRPRFCRGLLARGYRTPGNHGRGHQLAPRLACLLFFGTLLLRVPPPCRAPPSRVIPFFFVFASNRRPLGVCRLSPRALSGPRGLAPISIRVKVSFLSFVSITFCNTTKGWRNRFARGLPQYTLLPPPIGGVAPFE